MRLHTVPTAQYIVLGAVDRVMNFLLARRAGLSVRGSRRLYRAYFPLQQFALDAIHLRSQLQLTIGRSMDYTP